MASMNPQILPDDVLKNPFLQAEIRVYQALSKLSEEFDVYYDAWVSTNHAADAHARLIDFIVIHEKFGLLAIEVKGGKGKSGKGDGIRVSNDGSRFEQYHHNKKRYIKIDPHGQVSRAIHKLVEVAKAQGVDYFIPKNYCVVFPDTEWQKISTMPKAYVSSTLCAEAMPDLAGEILKLFPKVSNQAAWSRDAYLDMKRRLHSVPKELYNSGWGKRIYREAKAKVKRIAETKISFNPFTSPMPRLEEIISEPPDHQEQKNAVAALHEAKRIEHMSLRNNEPPEYEDRYIPENDDKVKAFSLWWGLPMLLAIIAMLLYIGWKVKRKFLN